MTISNADASHIAIYLAKGIFDNPSNKDVNIAIGDNAFIGIERRGHKYLLYIQLAEQRNKADMRSGFNENIKIDVLANNIKALIESSEALKDISLNMDKVPMLPEQIIPPPPAILYGNAGQNNMIPTDTFPPTEAVNETDPPGLELKEGELPILDVQEYSENEHEDDSIHDTPDGEKEQPILPDNSLLDSNQEITEEEEMNDETSNSTKVESALNAAGLLPVPVDTKKIPEMSYISQIIGDDEDIKQKMIKALNQLIIRDRESAVEFYIKIIYRLLPLFHNDIDSAHTGTGIDKRDLLLSVYEIQLFN